MPRRDTHPMAPGDQTRDVVESTSDDSSPLVADPRNQGALERIEQSNLGDRMKSALRRVASGEAIRTAAELEGYASHADVYRAAKRYGLIDLTTNKLVERHRRISNLAGEELECRLAEAPDKISTQQLGILQGISTDKVLASEKASTYDGSGYISALERLAEKATESGQGVEIRLAVGPLSPNADDDIDVTPTNDSTAGGS